MKQTLIAGAFALLTPFAAHAAQEATDMSNVQAPDPAPSTPVETAALAAFEPTREEAVLEAYVDGVVAAHMREHLTPGVTVSVVKDGKVLFAKGYGYADIDAGRLANGDETMFRIGSVSKTFIWTAVMMLHERGLIDLDVDVNQYLKGMQIPEKFGAPVTMNLLMAHRAGFEETFSVYTHNHVEEKRSLTELLIADMPERVFPPGERTSYSNWGAALAAKIVEEVTGQTFEAFVESEIFTPLEMTGATLKNPSEMPADLKADLVTGYDIKAGRAVVGDYMEIGRYAPPGAISATAADMAQWMLLHLGRGAHDGVRLLTLQTHDLMWRRAYDDRAAGAGVAHGFFNKTYLGQRVFSHAGGTATFYTYMVLAPDLGLGVYVSQNAANDLGLITQLPDLVIARLGGRAAPKISDTEELTAEEAEEYAGYYLANRRSFTGFEKFFAITAGTSVKPGKEGGLTVKARGDTIHYEPVRGSPDVFQDSHGNRIAFGRDDGGAVTHYSGDIGIHSSDRGGFLDKQDTFMLALMGALFFSVMTWFGAWRRQGRDINAAPAGVALAGFGLVAALSVFLFGGALMATISAVSAASAADIATGYPFAPIVYAQFAAYGVFAFAVLAVLSLVPAWARSGWGVWRKLHYSLFAMSLAFLAVALAHWNIVFSTIA